MQLMTLHVNSLFVSAVLESPLQMRFREASCDTLIGRSRACACGMSRAQQPSMWNAPAALLVELGKFEREVPAMRWVGGTCAVLLHVCFNVWPRQAADVESQSGTAARETLIRRNANFVAGHGLRSGQAYMRTARGGDTPRHAMVTTHRGPHSTCTISLVDE